MQSHMILFSLALEERRLRREARLLDAERRDRRASLGAPRGGAFTDQTGAEAPDAGMPGAETLDAHKASADLADALKRAMRVERFDRRAETDRSALFGGAAALIALAAALVMGPF